MKAKGMKVKLHVYVEVRVKVGPFISRGKRPEFMR
jgi:hypothetical protein